MLLQCKYPWKVNGVPVRCARCTFCRLARAEAMRNRGELEAAVAGESCLVTLTFRDEFVPKTQSEFRNRWRLFAMRLREAGYKRVLACGELGDRSGRPHCHAVVFGMSEVVGLGLVAKLWEDVSADRKVRKSLGHVQVKPLLAGGVRYVCDYLLKAPPVRSSMRGFDPEKLRPFGVFPRPGLGVPFFEYAVNQWVNDPFVLREMVRIGDVPPMLRVGKREVYFDRFSKQRLRLLVERSERLFAGALTREGVRGFDGLTFGERWKRVSASLGPLCGAFGAHASDVERMRSKRGREAIFRPGRPL